MKLFTTREGHEGDKLIIGCLDLDCVNAIWLEKHEHGDNEHWALCAHTTAPLYVASADTLEEGQAKYAELLEAWTSEPTDIPDGA